jgi:hypothetical protein
MPAHKKQVRGKTPRATNKVSAKKSAPPAKAAKPVRVEPQPLAKSPGEVGAHVRRLTGEVETLKAELRKRPGGAGPEASSRRDLDKILADRLARLDEKIESLWGRVADLEEHFEGEGGGRTREPDFDETPDRDFYER